RCGATRSLPVLGPIFTDQTSWRRTHASGIIGLINGLRSSWTAHCGLRARRRQLCCTGDFISTGHLHTGLCVSIRYPNRKRGPGRTIRNKSCPSWLFPEYGTHYCHGSPKSPYYRFCFRSVVFRDRLATMATFGRVNQSYSRRGNPCHADGFWHFVGWIPTAR